MDWHWIIIAIPTFQVKEKRRQHVLTSEEKTFLVPLMLVGHFSFFTISFLFFFLYLVFPFLGEHIPLSLKKHNHPLRRIILIIMHFLSKEELHFVILINDGPADLSCSDPSVEYIADQEDCGRYFRSFRSYVASTQPNLWDTYA